MKQFGGLKLKHPEKKGFAPVYEMLNHGEISLLTGDSLKGFMITLNVPKEHSEYSGINGTRFTKEVTSFILKLAVITPTNDEKLEDYVKGTEIIAKHSESKESYFEEAKLQQTIWKRSIAGGRPEICPSIANFSLFDNTDSIDFLIFLKSKAPPPNLEVAIDYLLRQVTNPLWSIGVITMPTIKNSVQFWDFVQDHPLRHQITTRINKKNMELVTDAYAHVTAQIVSLFMDIGVIHFDLHMGNALIYQLNGVKSVIIDFGRASDITNLHEDEYFSGNPGLEKKKELIKSKKLYYKEFFDLTDGSEKDKSAFIIRVLDTIADIDFEKNHTPSNGYQMDWYENYEHYKNAPAKAFTILKGLMIDPRGISGMPASRLATFEKDGNLVDFNPTLSPTHHPTRPLDNFIVKFPPPHTPPRTPPRTPSTHRSRANIPPLSIYPGRNMGGTKKNKSKRLR